KFLTSAQELLRIDRVAVDAGLVMQMRPRGTAGRSDLADDLADLDALPDLDVDLGEMPVARGEAVAVVDFNHPTVTAAPASLDHRAGSGGVNRISAIAAKINSGVHSRAPDERIGAYPEAG